MPIFPGISSRTTDADQIARYRSLLLEGPDGIGSEDDKNNVDMEITWEPDLLNNKKVNFICFVEVY